MKTKTWLWIGFGSAVGALLLLGRKKLGSPVEGTVAPRVTPHGHYGADRAGPPVHHHQGVDLVAPVGSRVLAIGDGMIVRANPGLGKTVRVLELDHPGTWGRGTRRVQRVVYADLGKPLVEPGDRVRKGDAVALVDKTGFVHFAVREKQKREEVFFDPKEAGFAYREGA